MNSSSNSERVVSIINDGKLAELAQAHFKTILEKKKLDILNRMMSEHRSGKTDPVLLSSFVAQVSLLDEIEQTIKRAIERGRKQEKEIFENGRDEFTESGS